MGDGSGNWVERWEDWRALLGPNGSLQRRRVMEYLEKRLCVMYWGDSWFSTPLYKNLAKQSWPRIDGVGIVIGRPGAQARELFTDSNLRNYLGWLQKSPFDVLCISAGGNDQLSERLSNVFRDWIDGRRAKVSGREAFKAEAKIFADALLFEGFRDMVLKPLAASRAYGEFFSYADFSSVPETADPAFWYDEIHPNEEGFRILAKAFNAHVRTVVPKAKQGAI